MAGEQEKLELVAQDQNGRRRNIILVGMMATGKSTVGVLLAEALGYELVDLDQVIVQTEGRTIADIFAESGEAGFRAVETRTLQLTLEGEGKIISTGGGAVLAAGNSELMLTGGYVVALTASEQAILSRVQGDGVRPLLAGNAQERIRTIMNDRRDAYRFAHCTVDTTELTAAEVTKHILMRYRG